MIPDFNSLVSDCRRYRPALLDTRMVTSWPLKYWKVSTLLAAERWLRSLASTELLTRSSKRTVSWGGMRLLSSVILYPAFFRGGTT
eukprot:1344-Prorocentrum_minimum.AAC.2